MVKIIQEREKCIGCGACAAICPACWEMAEDSKSTLKGAILGQNGNYELETDQISCNQDASDSCPVSIIHIEK